MLYFRHSQGPDYLTIKVTTKDRFAKYFRRKREEGKPKQLVINNIANKLPRILCGMIKNKQPYIENYQSVHPRLRKAGTRS
jgi:hypothetical protein